tara:strand:- start:315 stop:515 length:201 start_codon:yes stop_codon:yes gene_type:complete
MAKNNIVNLKEYKSQKAIEKQIAELDRIGEAQYDRMTSTEQQGYRNFMKLLKAVEQMDSPQKNEDT